MSDENNTNSISGYNFPQQPVNPEYAAEKYAEQQFLNTLGVAVGSHYANYSEEYTILQALSLSGTLMYFLELRKQSPCSGIMWLSTILMKRLHIYLMNSAGILPLLLLKFN